jgi:16S rRNA (cytosine1402-N4)-methyltransferase
MAMNLYHNPVLLNESIDGLAIKEDGVYVDVTYGGGGHAKKILTCLGKKGKLYAFDRDNDALKNKIEDARLVLINHNYRFLKNFLKYYKALPVDGIIADLGISSYQIDTARRGFSTRVDCALDLRMDQRKKRTGADIINSYGQDRLTKILREYGELDNAGKIAETIIEMRREKLLQTTADFKNALHRLATAGQENKFFARVFQALRIEVNEELESLKQMLAHSLEVLDHGGRLVVISYHSLEDRLVKNFIKTGDFSGKEMKDPIYGNISTPFRPITRKVIMAGEDEIKINNRARSARLRIAEKL